MSQIVKQWKKTPSKNHTHFFGEMDLDLTKTKVEIFEVAFYISEHCGYMVYNNPDNLELFGTDCEYFKIVFDGQKVKHIKLSNNKIVELDKIPEYSGYKNGFDYMVSVI